MHRTVRYIGFIVGLFACAGVSAATSHEGHEQAAAGGACAGVQVIPSLRCARAPSAVFDGRGRLWLAWAMAGHIYVNHSDDRGKSFSAPVVVNRIPEDVAADGENRPKVVLGAAGDVYVSWTQRLPQKYSGYIRFSHSRDGGDTFAEPVTVNDDLSVTSHRFDAMAATRDGRVYLFWLDKRDRLGAEKAGRPYIGAAIYYAVSYDHGRTFKPNRKLADHSCECCRIAVAVDGHDQPVVIWRHVFGDHVRDHALVRFSAAETPGPMHQVTDDHWRVEGCPHHGPSLAIGDGGRYHLTWFTNGPERKGLFYAQSTDGGLTFGVPVAIGSNEQGAAHPYVMARGKTVVITWKEFDGVYTHAKAMWSHDEGKHWSMPQDIAASEGKTDHPFLLGTGGEMFVSWQTDNEGYRLLPLDTRL